MIRSLNIWWAAALAALFAVAMPQSAFAQKRVAVLDFTGPSGGAVQAQITAGLKGESEVELVSAREVKSASSRLGNSLQSASDYKAVAEALELSAFVEGEVAKKGHRLQASVTVRNGSTGQVVHEETWSRRSNALKTIKPTVWTALGPAIEESSAPEKPKAKTKPEKKKAPPPPPPPPPEDEDEAAEEEEEEEQPRARRKQRDEEEEEREEEERAEKKKSKKKSLPGDKSPLHPALVLTFGPRIMWRTLTYEGSPTSTNFQTYSSTDEGSPSFNLALAAQWFPGAHKRNDWLSDLGVDFDLDYALGLKAKVADSNSTVKVSAYELGFGALYRLPLDSFQPFFRLGFVKHVFDVNLPSMPGLSYSSLRIGLGTAINLVDWLSFDVNFAYLAVLGVGELADADKGEDVSTKAWEAGFGAMTRFTDSWGARLAIDYRRYSYDFGLSDNPEVTLPKSGIDGYLRLTINAVWLLPGQKK